MKSKFRIPLNLHLATLIRLYKISCLLSSSSEQRMFDVREKYPKLIKMFREKHLAVLR